MADGFLGRWSQRKQAVREGKPLVEPMPPLVQPGTAADAVVGTTSAVARATPTATGTGTLSASSLAQSAQEGSQTQLPAPPAPTLDDVQALKPDDSFARFVAPDVSPQVRNAAMKKLFTDPHYNVMDGLDIYIDDYSIASPLSAATLRQMASAKFLNLFEEDPPEAEGKASATIGEDAHTAAAPSVAQSADTPKLPDTAAPLPSDTTENTSHDDLDLRLQPDHAAGLAGFEREPERATDAAQQPVPTRSR